MSRLPLKFKHLFQATSLYNKVMLRYLYKASTQNNNFNIFKYLSLLIKWDGGDLLKYGVGDRLQLNAIIVFSRSY